MDETLKRRRNETKRNGDLSSYCEPAFKARARIEGSARASEDYSSG